MQDDQFLTLAEIAELAQHAANADRVKLPRTLRGWAGLANKRGWDKRSDRLIQVREGGNAYHVSLLPGAIRVLLPPVAPDVTNIITQRDEDRAEARKAIINAISRYRRENNLSEKVAILAFVEALKKAHAASAKMNRELLRLEEFGLEYSIVAAARNWNTRKGKWTVGRSTLYEWKAEVEGPGKPRPERSTEHVWEGSHFAQEIAKWHKFLSEAHDSTLEWFVCRHEARIIRILERHGYRITRKDK